MVTAGREAPLPAYVCVVSKEHVVEPFELSAAASDAFWREAMLVARLLADLARPTKMNYEIHGNTIPHLHMHVFPFRKRSLRRRPDRPDKGRIHEKRCGARAPTAGATRS